jgi:hypothetical protein
MRRLIPLCVGIVLVISASVRASVDTINEQLEALEENVRLATIETYTAWQEVGQTIVFNDRVLRMGHHFVPGDPRRGGFYDIAWLSDQVNSKAGDLTLEQTQSAVSNAMATWDEVTCSTIPLTELPDFGWDWGVVQSILGYGGSGFPFADVTHAGWLPPSFFDLIEPSGGIYILGATFTFVFTDEGGEFTDIDNNNKLDVAFREIYYNTAFEWSVVDPVWPAIDVETVVLHETGHGLSQGHFGKLFKTNANGKFHFAPRAVMNAGYTGVRQHLTGTDIGGHCSIWAAWPRK